MRFTSAIVASILGFALSGVLAAPLPQVAGEGSACGSVLTQTDNGVGYGTENAEDNTANTVSSTKGGARRFRIRRQIAGEGNACDSVLTQTDNGVGYGTENAEDNTAKTISSGQLTSGSTSSGGSSSSSGSSPPPPPPPNRRRQLDKISKGAQTLGNAAGAGSETAPVTTEGENVDGQATGDASTAGAQVGGDEATALEQAGSDIYKKRQLDKISKGAQTLSDAAGTGSETSSTTTELENVDGESTGDASNAGATIGSTEASTLENAGSTVP